MMPRTEEQLSRFKHRDSEGLFEWENFRKHGQGCRKPDRPRQHYPIWLMPNGELVLPKMSYDEQAKEWMLLEQRPGNVIEIWPNKGKEKRVWLWSPENFQASPHLFKHELVRGEHTIYKKRRPTRIGVVPNTMWTDTRYSANEHGSGMIVKIFGSTEPFDFPKSIYTVADCISVATSRKDALIVDFFAGSGSTFHAIALLNAEDGGTRRSLLVTNNEVKEAVNAQLRRRGLYPGDAEYEANGIAEAVAWPRCKSVVEGKRPEGTPLPGRYVDGRDLAEGFAENIEYFRVDLVDPAFVERGDAFEGVLPILWLIAGAIGERESRRGSTPWYLATHSPFAVLIREAKFNEFRAALRKRSDLDCIFLVTDSDDNFAAMRRELGRRYRCTQLYKSYLDNFRINAVDKRAAGDGGESE